MVSSSKLPVQAADQGQMVTERAETNTVAIFFAAKLDLPF